MKKLFAYSLLIITTYSFGQIGIASVETGILDVRDKPAGNLIDIIHDGDLFFIADGSEGSIWVEIQYGENQKHGFINRDKTLNLNELDSPKKPFPELVFETKEINDFEKRRFHGGMNLPLTESYELKNIELVHDCDTVSQNSKFSKDVLTPFLISGRYSHNKLASIDKLEIYSYKNFTYYRLKLGDGSEYYESIWAVKNCEIVQRLIGWLF